jgi:hypothetical protein
MTIASMPRLRTRELISLRLSALGLHRPPRGSGIEHSLAQTHRMLAVQGQDLPGTLWAIAARSDTATRAQVEDLFNRGQLIRTWVFRGTLHVLTREQAVRVMSLMGPRALKTSTRRRADLGLTEAVVDRARETLIEALRDQDGLTRAEVRELWSHAGLALEDGRLYHLIVTCCMHGDVVWGAIDGTDQKLSLAPWHTGSEGSALKFPHDVDETYDHIIRGIIAGRGPLSAEDISYWSTFGKSVVARSLERLATDLTWVTVPHSTVPFVALTEQLDAALPSKLPGAHLNAGFDELLLGYRDRSPQLVPGDIDRIVPGRNGMFKAHVVRNGVVAGTWTRKDRSKDSAVLVSLFDGQAPNAAFEKALARQAIRYGRYLERPVSFSLV